MQYIHEIKRKTSPAFDTDAYPFHLPIVQALHNLPLHPKVTYFIGDNGTGKSTLIEAIAVAFGFNAEGGSINFSFSTKNTTSSLYKHIILSKSGKRPKDGFFFRAESFYNVATEVDNLSDVMPLYSSYGGKSLHNQSHGESFFSLFLHRFWGNGLYILDEPESALSTNMQFAFLSRLHELVEQNSQVIIATHSPIILAYPESIIYRCDEHGLTETEYLESEPYALTKLFINNPDRMLHELFRET